jgi:hypothetical protein
MISSNDVPGRLLFGLAFVSCAVAVKSGRIRNDLFSNCVQLLCVKPCVKCDSRYAKNEGSCRIKIALVAGIFPMKNPIFPCIISCVIYVSTIAGGRDTKRENMTHQKEKGLVNHRFTRPLCAQDRISLADPSTLARGVPNDPSAPTARGFFRLSALASQLAPLPNKKNPSA